MELIALFVFWGGMLGMLWILKMGSTLAESSLKKTKPISKPRKIRVVPTFRAPDSVGNIIGQYMNNPIYCKITINEKDYHFNRIEPLLDSNLKANEWIVGPGIVYSNNVYETA